MKISLRRRHPLAVADGAFGDKIDYVTFFKERFGHHTVPSSLDEMRYLILLIRSLRQMFFVGLLGVY